MIPMWYARIMKDIMVAENADITNTEAVENTAVTTKD